MQDTISRLSIKFKQGSFDKFIKEVHFPLYKNFAPATKMEFRFPLSVIVGPNGGGKSSILHALWGMPLGCSTSRFWFSTPVDPIDVTNGRNRYWYSHYVKDLRRHVQCRKMTGNKRNGYWEPTRPNQSEGMDKMPAKDDDLAPYMSDSGDRWNQVDRVPVYINSKAESSAFERFFYYTSEDSLEAKQQHFLRYSGKLREVVGSGADSLSYYNVQRVFSNLLISESSLASINSILGKGYKSARYIAHDLYGKIKSSSIIFETERRRYSECFAGSGELAVVNTVLAVERLKQYDLLLLDEPETSLHPGAQKRLLKYLLDVALQKEVQVVLSTHSPTFVDLLPEEALIVLDEAPDGVRVRGNPSKTGAFYRLGQPSANKTLFLAEDPLLAALVKMAWSKLPPEIKAVTEVEPATVGASEMLSNQVKAFSTSGSKVVMILDGDQSDLRDIFGVDLDALSPKAEEQLVSSLRSYNVSLVGGNSFFREWASWCKAHVLFIDQVCAEEVLLMCLKPAHPLLSSTDKTNKKFKSAVRDELKSRALDVDSAAMVSVFKTLLTYPPDANTQVALIVDALKRELESVFRSLNA